MKVKLSYNDLTLILGLLEKREEEVKTRITCLESEVREIGEEQGTIWASCMEEKAAMRYEELQEAIRTDYDISKELSGLIMHLRNTR